MKKIGFIFLVLTIMCTFLMSAPVFIKAADKNDVTETNIGDARKKEDEEASVREHRQPYFESTGYSMEQEGEVLISEYEADGLSAEVSGSVNDTINWNLSTDGVLTVSGTGAMQDMGSRSDIPWYDYRLYITEVKVEEGITKIGASAFYECWYLQSADIAATVTAIGDGAFADTIISSITGMENVSDFGNFVFQGSEFTVFTFPAATRTIGQSPFYNSDKLTSVTLPATVTDIKSGFSMNCTALKEIKVAAGNTAYCDVDGILYNKTKTIIFAYPASKAGSSYSILSGVTKVENYAFSYSQNLETVNIPQSVTILGEGAFYCMAKLNSANVPATVTETGDFLFAGSSLKTLYFQASVATTPYEMCMDCTSLQTVTLSNTAIKELYLRAFMNCTALSSVILPSNLEEIDVYAFKGCSQLTGIAYPATLTYIQSGAFADSGITTFPDWLSKNGRGDYVQLANLTYSGTYLYDYAYQVLDLVNKERALAGGAPLSMDQDLLDAAMLRSGELALNFGHDRPDGSDCFCACAKMLGENIAAGQSTPALVMDSWMNSAGHKANILNASYTSIGIGCFTQGGILYWVQCFGTNTVTAFSKPSDRNVTVTNAIVTGWLTGDHFQFKSRTYDLNDDETVQVCPRLWNMGWNQVVCDLDAINFNWTTDNTDVATINGYGLIKAVSAGSYTVTGTLKCAPYTILSTQGTVKKSNQEEIDIGDGKKHAKYKVTGKNTVTFCGIDGATGKVKIPDTILANGKVYKVTSIAAKAFQNNKKITGVSIGKNVKKIGTSAFSGCTKLKTVSMGSSITTISDKAFYKCSALNKITIPKKVSKIGKKAFYGCKKLKTITIKTTKLKSSKVGAGAFSGTPKNAVVKVPKSKLSSYKKLLVKKGIGKKAKIKK